MSAYVDRFLKACLCLCQVCICVHFAHLSSPASRLAPCTSTLQELELTHQLERSFESCGLAKSLLELTVPVSQLARPE